MTAVTGGDQVLVAAVVGRTDVAIQGHRGAVRQHVGIRQGVEIAAVFIPAQGAVTAGLTRGNHHAHLRAIVQREAEGLVRRRCIGQAIRVAQGHRVGDRARILVAARRQLGAQRRRHRVGGVGNGHSRRVAGVQVLEVAAAHAVDRHREAVRIHEHVFTLGRLRVGTARRGTRRKVDHHAVVQRYREGLVRRRAHACRVGDLLVFVHRDVVQGQGDNIIGIVGDGRGDHAVVQLHRLVHALGERLVCTRRQRHRVLLTVVGKGIIHQRRTEHRADLYRGARGRVVLVLGSDVLEHHVHVGAIQAGQQIALFVQGNHLVVQRLFLGTTVGTGIRQRVALGVHRNYLQRHHVRIRLRVRDRVVEDRGGHAVICRIGGQRIETTTGEPADGDDDGLAIVGNVVIDRGQSEGRGRLSSRNHDLGLAGVVRAVSGSSRIGQGDSYRRIRGIREADRVFTRDIALYHGGGPSDTGELGLRLRRRGGRRRRRLRAIDNRHHALIIGNGRATGIAQVDQELLRGLFNRIFVGLNLDCDCGLTWSKGNSAGLGVIVTTDDRRRVIQGTELNRDGAVNSFRQAEGQLRRLPLGYRHIIDGDSRQGTIDNRHDTLTISDGRTGGVAKIDQELLGPFEDRILIGLDLDDRTGLTWSEGQGTGLGVIVGAGYRRGIVQGAELHRDRLVTGARQ